MHARPRKAAAAGREEGGEREPGRRTWIEDEGVNKEADEKEEEEPSWPLRCALVAFSGNLIGIATARTLHYQFYAWYFHTLPLLLWAAAPLAPTPLRLALLGAVEWAFNVFPATPASSAALTLCHIALVGALWFSPAMPPLPKGRKAKET